MKISTKNLTKVFALVTITLVAITLCADGILAKSITYLLSCIFTGATVCGVIELIVDRNNN